MARLFKNNFKNVANNINNGIVKLDKLSDSLNHLANEGFNDFYEGDVSKEILKTVKQEGGHVTSKILKIIN